jgi:twitching motility two-component system response regulator PilG
VTKRILIVDDTKTLPKLVRVYLLGCGFDFEEAHDGEEAYSKAQVWRPDLVIADVQMPKMSGFELCAAIRADPELQRVPVVLLTSLRDNASRRKASLVGASAFLNKPVQVEELCTIVARLLSLRAGV